MKRLAVMFALFCLSCGNHEPDRRPPASNGSEISQRADKIQAEGEAKFRDGLYDLAVTKIEEAEDLRATEGTVAFNVDRYLHQAKLYRKAGDATGDRKFYDKALTYLQACENGDKTYPHDMISSWPAYPDAIRVRVAVLKKLNAPESDIRAWEAKAESVH